MKHQQSAQIRRHPGQGFFAGTKLPKTQSGPSPSQSICAVPGFKLRNAPAPDDSVRRSDSFQNVSNKAARFGFVPPQNVGLIGGEKRHFKISMKQELASTSQNLAFLPRMVLRFD